VLECFNGPVLLATLLQLLRVRLGLAWRIHRMERGPLIDMELQNFASVQRCFGGRSPLSCWCPEAGTHSMPFGRAALAHLRF
jgi:hypothetical protein